MVLPVAGRHTRTQFRQRLAAKQDCASLARVRAATSFDRGVKGRKTPSIPGARRTPPYGVPEGAELIAWKFSSPYAGGVQKVDAYADADGRLESYPITRAAASK